MPLTIVLRGHAVTSVPVYTFTDIPSRYCAGTELKNSEFALVQEREQHNTQQQQHTYHSPSQTTIAIAMVQILVSQRSKGFFQHFKYVSALIFNVTKEHNVCLPIKIRLGDPPIEFISADAFT